MILVYYKASQVQLEYKRSSRSLAGEGNCCTYIGIHNIAWDLA